jgi:hypothetical protein
VGTADRHPHRPAGRVQPVGLPAGPARAPPRLPGRLPDAQDAESLNNTLERAFYGQRLPAWGTPNQTVIVLLACLAQNAWARHTHQVAQSRPSSGPPTGRLSRPHDQQLSVLPFRARRGKSTAREHWTLARGSNARRHRLASTPKLPTAKPQTGRPRSTGGFPTGKSAGPALVAQGIEHRSPKAGVARSNRAEGTSHLCRSDDLRGSFRDHHHRRDLIAREH